MSNRETQKFSLFRSNIANRRFDGGTLRILESLLVSKDVKSLMELHSSLREFLRHELLRVFHDISERSVDHKLSILEFFVHAFALIGDVESCLALRYEALVLRELKATSDRRLQVSYREWLTFAEHLLDNEFYAIARKACEKALLLVQRNDTVNPETDEFFDNVLVIEQIKRLKDVAVGSASSRSVQAQAAEYLKKKTVGQSSEQHLDCKNIRCLGSMLFRNGIKKHNLRKFNESLSMQQISCRQQSTQD
ncbi:unnamed protein product [Ilex paraguariensis]|uniref:Uncharacterized protein n=1 Tax=Ilex paraguariensis TaxID=185542 RepID=A0ABC8TXI8_9AQUA